MTTVLTSSWRGWANPGKPSGQPIPVGVWNWTARTCCLCTSLNQLTTKQTHNICITYFFPHVASKIHICFRNDVNTSIQSHLRRVLREQDWWNTNFNLGYVALRDEVKFQNCLNYSKNPYKESKTCYNVSLIFFYVSQIWRYVLTYWVDE